MLNNRNKDSVNITVAGLIPRNAEQHHNVFALARHLQPPDTIWFN